ncbi:hypothetical protein BRADI_3g31931v3 [Brachypodium distachyon]|uniref:Uncharacterized protein n=1 Tax=Brachypodium distachyon TaxID=15368 RepID=A0A2K2D0G3_BRADI|nr:hypothetical protein BRADI_3g31931v3 [Brachypodium distachyon]
MAFSYEALARASRMAESAPWASHSPTTAPRSGFAMSTCASTYPVSRTLMPLVFPTRSALHDAGDREGHHVEARPVRAHGEIGDEEERNKDY